MKTLQKRVQVLYRFRCERCRSKFEMTEEEKLENDLKFDIGDKSNPYHTSPSNPLDHFDCPVCGCQNVMQERKRIFVTKEDVDELQVIPECFGEYDEMCQICDVMEACKRKETEESEEV